MSAWIFYVYKRIRMREHISLTYSTRKNLVLRTYLYVWQRVDRGFIISRHQMISSHGCCVRTAGTASCGGWSGKSTPYVCALLRQVEDGLSRPPGRGPTPPPVLFTSSQTTLRPAWGAMKLWGLRGRLCDTPTRRSDESIVWGVECVVASVWYAHRQERSDDSTEKLVPWS